MSARGSVDLLLKACLILLAGEELRLRRVGALSVLACLGASVSFNWEVFCPEGKSTAVSAEVTGVSCAEASRGDERVR